MGVDNLWSDVLRRGQEPTLNAITAIHYVCTFLCTFRQSVRTSDFATLRQPEKGEIFSNQQLRLHPDRLRASSSREPADTVSARHQANMRLPRRFFVLPTIQPTNAQDGWRRQFVGERHVGHQKKPPEGGCRSGHQPVESCLRRVKLCGHRPKHSIGNYHFADQTPLSILRERLTSGVSPKLVPTHLYRIKVATLTLYIQIGEDGHQTKLPCNLSTAVLNGHFAEGRVQSDHPIR